MEVYHIFKRVFTEFFLIQVASKTHITPGLYARSPQHHKGLAPLSQQLHPMAAWETLPRVPPAHKAFWKRFILKWSILTYPIPFLSLGVPNVCLNQGDVLLPLLGYTVAVSYLLVKKPEFFYIYFLKWSHIKELRKKAIQSWWLMYNVYKSVKTKY